MAENLQARPLAAPESGPEYLARAQSLREMEQEIEKGERTLEALKADERAGKSILSPDQLGAMEKALENMQRSYYINLYEGEGTLERRSAEDEAQYGEGMRYAEMEAAKYEKALTVLGSFDNPRGRRVYGVVRNRMLDFHDHFEDFVNSLPPNNPTRMAGREREEGLKETFLRMLQRDVARQPASAPLDTDFVAPGAAPEGERRLSPDEYDKQVRTLFEGVGGIQSMLDLLARKNALDEKSLLELHDQLDLFYVKLQELDEQRAEEKPSRERQALIGLIKHIHDQYPVTLQPVPPEQVAVPGSPASDPRIIGPDSPFWIQVPPAPLKLSNVRALHKEVRATYANISHLLGEDERRAYRRRIAQLTAMVRHAEHQQWHRLFVAPPKASDDITVRARDAVRLAVAKAQAIAPAIAQAVAPGPVSGGGFLAALGAAFRLK